MSRLVLLQAQVHLVEVHLASAVQHRHAIAPVGVLELDPVGPNIGFAENMWSEKQRARERSRENQRKPTHRGVPSIVGKVPISIPSRLFIIDVSPKSAFST